MVSEGMQCVHYFTEKLRQSGADRTSSLCGMLLDLLNLVKPRAQKPNLCFGSEATGTN